MKPDRIISVIDSHTAGEPTRVVTGGLPPIPGASMREKRAWLEREQDDLRRLLINEPRGHGGMVGAIITPPVSPEADAGVIFMDNDGYLDMCGHGTIGVVTVFVETGMAKGPEVVLDTPAGQVSARAKLDAQGIAVSFRNVASFYYSSEAVTVEGLGRVKLDIAYGGNYFALLEAAQVELVLSLDNLKEFIRLGMAIKEAANKEIHLTDPATGQPSRIDLVEFFDEGSEPTKNLVIFGSGQFDRSPCGTGTCAKMALLHARGRLGISDVYPHQSIIGTVFTGRVAAEAKVGQRPAIIPEITGTAHIIGMGQLILDKDDPFPSGLNLP